MDSLSQSCGFTQMNEIPDRLTEVLPGDLYQILPGPTLIHLQGEKPEPLLISILLHGNESTGFFAVQSLLQEYQSRPLPRSISIFIGNIIAAKENMRRLDTQPDFNRIWPGTELSESDETKLAESVIDEMVRRKVFASIDIHNNTGLNPHYVGVHRFQNRHFQLARLFSRLVVYFIRPKGVLSAAFSSHCPSVTLECGKPGQKYGVNHALEFLHSCLHLTAIPDCPVAVGDMDLFHLIAQVTILDHISFGFATDQTDLELITNIDHMNFTEIARGTVIGTIRTGGKTPLLVRDEFGTDVTSRYFQVQENQLVLKRDIMPSMFALDPKIIRQDCLCYVMERITALPENHDQ